MELPESTRRLFAHVPAEEVADPAGRELLIGRLLEEGATADLRWLVSELGEAELRRWLEARGGRQLSARSRWFWQRVLGADPSAGADPAKELWPL